jgi:hypothetical protein
MRLSTLCSWRRCCGVDAILRVQHDAIFGPMVMFGLGGVFVELFKYVAFAPAPLSQLRAAGLVDAVRGARLLDGWRGGPVLGRAALVDTVCRPSAFAVQQAGAVRSVAINPFVVLDTGGMALDALVEPA